MAALLYSCLLSLHVSHRVNAFFLSTQTNEKNETAFSCDGRIDGFYGDTATDCSSYFVCENSNLYRLECPEEMAFDVSLSSCVSQNSFDCRESETYSSSNPVSYTRFPILDAYNYWQNKAMTADTFETAESSTYEHPTAASFAGHWDMLPVQSDNSRSAMSYDQFYNPLFVYS
ncbi:hypothetical protein B4U80_07291 [Leptotrombidium deliense]|uniref:Chitin-binding type-2 domain-containing protein n=1 Tax=Leptotrombidium deliense TaxID=299467 RepID=A0A443S9P6_9ACAR|nr:hypothetical protein B4U80_07291 [Leptotrombidium deliense]